jgi:hypothetical protein
MHHQYRLLKEKNQMNQSPLKNFISLFSSKEAGFFDLDKLFSAEFLKVMINQFKNIREKWKVRLINGAVFDPLSIKYKDVVPACKDFVVLEFQKSSKSMNNFRLYWCKFDHQCHKLVSSPSKFYDHLRSHTKDTPYECELCQHCFS